MVFWGSPLIRGNKRTTDQWASTKHGMEGFSLHNSSLVGHQNQAKCENDCISRNGHRIKITLPNLMILVSFSSGEDALSNDVKIYHTFSSQGTENPPFRFLGGQPVYYIAPDVCHLNNRIKEIKNMHIEFSIILIIFVANLLHTGLWGLVNNAGISVACGLQEWYTREDFKRVLDVNILGVMDMCVTFLPLVRKAKGRIVNMASTEGRFALPSGAYAVSKFGVEAFSDSVRSVEE